MKNLCTCSDNELVSLFQGGNSDAIGILIDRYKTKVYNSILFMVKDDWLADDIFQETFIKIIDSLRYKRYDEVGKFLPWAIRISHNLCIDFFRKKKRDLQYRESDDISESSVFSKLQCSEDNEEVKIQKKQSYSSMFKMLNLLSEEQREVIVLRHFADLSFKEIATLMDCSINTALGRMRYGLINLRKIMEDHKVVL